MSVANLNVASSHHQHGARTAAEDCSFDISLRFRSLVFSCHHIVAAISVVIVGGVSTANGSTTTVYCFCHYWYA